MTSPYLSGNFAPVREEVEHSRLRVIGEIPRDLEGAYLRIGPNPRFESPGAYHWFDGDGMVHGVFLEGGRASYRNRWVRTKGFRLEEEKGEAIWPGFMEPPRTDLPEGPMKNVANTALVRHHGKLFALWEAGEPHEIRLPDLATVGPDDFCGRLLGAFTAHPKVDPETGEMMYIGYGPFPPYLRYGVVSPEGEIVHTAEIDLPVASMMHDFAITRRHSIFMDLPVKFRIERAFEGKMPITWEPETGSRFGIVPRHGSNADVRWFEGPPGFVFHVANAYEDGDAVVLTACRMESTSVLGAAAGAPGGDEWARLHRWRFDLATGETTEEPLDDVPTDFPRVNEAHTGRRHRYSYAAVHHRGDMPLFEGATKLDHDTGRVETHRHGAGRYGGELVFAPRPGARDEDDGWLLGFVHDEREDRSELVIVDAKDLAAPPIARVVIPTRVPYGFHGAWAAA